MGGDRIAEQFSSPANLSYYVINVLHLMAYLHSIGLGMGMGPLYQGWEAWPHAHLSEKLKSISIC